MFVVQLSGRVDLAFVGVDAHVHRVEIGWRVGAHVGLDVASGAAVPVEKRILGVSGRSVLVKDAVTVMRPFVHKYFPFDYLTMNRKKYQLKFVDCDFMKKRKYGIF